MNLYHLLIPESLLIQLITLQFIGPVRIFGSVLLSRNIICFQALVFNVKMLRGSLIVFGFLYLAGLFYFRNLSFILSIRYFVNLIIMSTN